MHFLISPVIDIFDYSKTHVNFLSNSVYTDASRVTKGTRTLYYNFIDKTFCNMSKPTTIKDAIKKWEEKHPGQNIGEAKEVGFQFQFPPIEKMDNSLSVLNKCEKLSLSTNMIEKISGIGSLKNLKILSLARNYIKNFSGLEAVADTLEELWISYNSIEKVKGIGVLKKLKVLYMSNNLVKDWAEFNKLQELPNLQDLLFVGNPLYDSLEESVWKTEAAKRLPNLKKLDGETVLRDENGV